jgi:hypothetical protein
MSKIFLDLFLLFLDFVFEKKVEIRWRHMWVYFIKKIYLRYNLWEIYICNQIIIS